MNIKRILLTGDDGYNAIGTRLLVYFLKDRYELVIAGTKNQQSAVGGHMAVVQGGTWGEENVDGVPAVWASSFPADAVELGQNYFKKPFDLAISGINLGVNIGGAVMSSGTFAAGHRAVDLKIAPVALIMSWDTHHSMYHREHNGKENLSKYVTYPGSAAYDLITLAQKNDFWGAKIVNINFPSKPSRRVRFTKPLPTLKEFYRDMKVDRTHHTFSFPEDDLTNRINTDIQYDSGAVLSGYISISLFKMNFVDESLYQSIKSREFIL